jgi:hypothetical protein
MTRHLKRLVAALLIAFGAASLAEAAPRKVIRHRPKHSSRVATGVTSTTGTRASTTRRRVAAKKKARTRARRRAAKKSAARSRAARRLPATKPH